MRLSMPLKNRFLNSALLGALTAGLGACGSSDPAGDAGSPALGAEKLSVVVLVIDSLMPSDIGLQTPTLSGLIADGTFYPESRSVFAAETIPNHVAMMTGVYPERSGITGNNFIDFDDPAGPTDKDLSLPEKLTAKTLFTFINEQCRGSGINPDIRHGATLSKKYLYEVFAGDDADPERQNDDPAVFNVAPDTHWDPTTSPLYIGPLFEYTPDRPTMQQALAQLPDADFFFVNLGSVDRNAHAFGAAGRGLQLLETDSLVQQMVDALKTSGRWDHTVMLVVSDHGMDFTLPGPLQSVTVQPTLDALGACYAPMQAVQGGGTDSIYVTDRSLPDDQKREALHAARSCLMGLADCDTLCAGASRPTNAADIVYAWYTQDDPTDPTGNMPDSIRSQHPNFGDLVLVASDGLKFSDPTPLSNPIPGNHGQIATIHNFMLVTGGSPWVKKGLTVTPSVPSPDLLDRLPEQSETIDVAPTVAWLLGLGLKASDFPDGKTYDGRVLSQAFVQFDGASNPASPTVCGRYDAE